MKVIATISISGIGYTGCYWEIDGLSYLWDTDQYINAYVTFNGTSSSPVYPPPSPGTTYNTPSTLYSSLSSGTTYTAIGYVVTPLGTYATSNSYTFTTPVPRPSNWNWYTSKTQNATMPSYNGKPAPVSAAEWNDFASRIDSFRKYKGLGSYGFTTASSGGDFYYWIFNQAVNGISAMSPPTPPPSTVSSGQTVTAYMLNGLRDSLNSIP